ncbi:MAG: YHYH protein [Leptospiraceae bacterium]|nr:YHYH protein [Leptospiraceae bacterium]
MKSFHKISITIFGVLVLLLQMNCGNLTGSNNNDDSNRTLLIAAAAVLNSSASSSTGSSCSSATSTGSTITPTTATLDATTGCVTGVTTCLDKALPSWIKDNFKCVVGYVSGTNYIIKSKNLPNTKSYYYTSYTGMTASTTAPLYEGLPSGNSKAGTNVVKSLTLTYTIPATPSKGSGTVSTQGGYVSVGVTLNGLAVFNNAAAAPDVLADEALTFDNYQGHPQNSGVYHHHAGVPKVCSNTANTSNSGACKENNKLIGVALDGYPIYSQFDSTGKAPTLDSFQGTTSVTTEFPNGTYNYRYAYNSTATINSLLSSFFYGNVGSVSDK